MRNVNISLTNNLILLERGQEELLLANSTNLQPLYIKSGRNHIKRLLGAVPELRTLEKIQQAFPDDIELVQMLQKHRIFGDCEQNVSTFGKPDLSCMKAWKKDRPAMSVYLLLTQSCNLGCSYCLNGAMTYKAEKALMSEEIAYAGVKKCLESLNPDGKLEIVFFGGEPLLNWPLAKKVILFCESNLKRQHQQKQIVYHMTSNLSFLPSDLIEWAQKYQINFLCDIDGPPKIHDKCRPYKGGGSSYRDITANVQRLVDSGLNVSLRATVTSFNQHHMIETAALHKSLGARGSAFVPVNPVNSDEVILKDEFLPSPEVMIRGLQEIYKSKIWDSSNLFPFSVYASKIHPGTRIVMGCGAPYGNTPVVDVHGGVHPCIYLVGIKRFYLGNLMQDDYPQEEVLDGMMDLLHVDNLEDCRECSWRYICGGGCPVGRLTILDNLGVTLKVKNYCNKINCDYTKAVLELLFWELAQEAYLSVAATDHGNPSFAIDHSSALNC